MLLFKDSFEGGTLNENMWEVQEGSGQGRRLTGKNNIIVSDACLKL